VNTLVAVAFALPWGIVPVVTLLRARRSRSLDEHPASVPADAPLISIVIPARNEARNIERCVRSALAADHPRLEVVAVNDHSTDSTGAILRRIAAEDARLRVVVPPALPDDWFGKQWACATGADASRGAVIGFFDADTVQQPDLVPRVINAMQDRRAELLTVAGTQELGSFWERVLQPQLFIVMLIRFGGTESVNRSSRSRNKIANGQCIFFRRDAYMAMGGHAAVRDKVAEDLSLAQLYCVRGRRAFLVLGLEQLSTRMYTSLRELVEGWGKNVYAGGRDAMPFGALGKLLYPLALVAPALAGLIPPMLLLLGFFGVVSGAVLLWAALVTAASMIWWLLVYRWLRLSPLYALAHPLGSAVLLYITLRSIIMGRRIQWKGRSYRTT
jgi:glycosyltransferase involved in cell wall biosynthesis